MSAFVERLVADQWSGTTCEEDTFFEPDFDTIAASINALNAETKTMLSLYGKDGAYLTIGRGNDRYIAYLTTSDEQFWNLLSQNNDHGTVFINVGGQIGDFPAKQVLNHDMVVQAARVFLRAVN